MSIDITLPVWLSKFVAPTVTGKALKDGRVAFPTRRFALLDWKMTITSEPVKKVAA